MLYVLGLGFLIGMKHALEADHVAAVASLASGGNSVGETTKMGVAWGLGHTATLFLIGSVVLLLDWVVPETMAEALEFTVGVMLVALGIDVMVRMARGNAHFHAHTHGGSQHFHAHRHAEAAGHDSAAHAHVHPRGLPLRALLVGSVHGLAGSAALVLLTLSTIQSVWLGLAYMLLFGLGSVAGMALLSCAIALPLRFTAQHMNWAFRGLTAAIGGATMVLGASIAWRIASHGGLFA
ncbi:MAG TPA: sulfite exporter TauE/SafE family protein [Alphaproteobacteria bacterium]|nr:sulfite exporter TauE/SafE family protein [Alphaproteobacteria bacterium]